MAVRSTQGRNRAARSTQGGVTLMEMDCGTCIIFIRFKILDQVYCNKSQNKMAQRALDRSHEEKVKGHSGAIYRGPLMVSTKYW